MARCDQDEKGFSFWSLERVRWVPEELAEEAPVSPSFPDAENFYAFADYLGWSWAYAIRLSELPGPAPVILIGKDSPALVARSFGEFVDLYLADSSALYGSPPLGPSFGLSSHRSILHPHGRASRTQPTAPPRARVFHHVAAPRTPSGCPQEGPWRQGVDLLPEKLVQIGCPDRLVGQSSPILVH